ncbi:Hypothetical predicted protein [Mytilus galloprovincialis]|uniref:Uncharacterized protein n=1 Tax=Mytilus galloprovincialis TaxID=29158 RepID=A0A8B6EB43_MYTGA|nr:Hypothetical predicted protein [Mytilus galloprovincialis]
MADSTLTQDISIALYRYMCHNIVGSEEHVNTIRLMNTARDNLLCDNRAAVMITSGSFGEGLDMKGSDPDLMFVHKRIEVYEDVQPNLNTSITYFSMETDNVKPGFTQLLLKHACLQFVFDVCEKINGKYYCSSALYKESLMVGQQMKIHGPCISDDDGWFDHAFCFHCKSWISIAKQWIGRSNNSWPNYIMSNK